VECKSVNKCILVKKIRRIP